MTQAELNERIRLHGLYLAGEGGGRMLDLRGADLRGANLSGANLRGADLRRADLRGANLSWANLSGANLRGADLLGADLLGADLLGADLLGADLLGADLLGADLSGATLRGANLSGANLNRCLGNLQEIKSIQIETWPVTYTADTLQIGCQRHPIARWREWRNDLEWIRQMDSKAEAWAERHLDLVLAMIDASPAMPTVHEEDNK